MRTQQDPRTSSSLAFRTYRWEGLVFNAACAVYFIFLGPVIVDAADAAMRDPEVTVIWLGVLLLIVSLAEIWAFPVKMNFVREAVRNSGDVAGKAFFLWMFHAVISIVLVFMIAESFGVEITNGGEAKTPVWMALVMPATVIKELAFLAILGWGQDDASKHDPSYARPNFREWIADGILVAYACVAYSATWGAIARGMELQPDNPVMFVINVLAASLVFLIFYLPLRIPYGIEELAQLKTTRDRLRLAASILVVMIPALAFN